MRLTKSLLMALAVTLMAATLFSGCSREARKARHAGRGDAYFQKQEYSKAEVEYLTALQNAPRDPDLIRKLGSVYQEQGRAIPALRALNAAKELQTNNVEVRFRLANVLFSLRDYPQARAEALFVAQHQPTNTAALLLLTDTAFQREDVAETRKLVEQTSKQVGANAIVGVANANLLLREGNLAGAEDELKKATALQSKDPALDLGWARLRLAQTNMLEAEVLLKRAAEASPANSLPRLQWGDFRIGLGDYTGAKQIFETITKQMPDFIPAWHRLAEIALVEKRYSDCESITGKILGLDDGNYQASLLRARMWAAQEKTDRSLQELGRLSTLYPRSPQVQYELAVAQLQSGDTGKASAALNETLRLDPRFAQAILLRSELDLRSGNAANAVNSLADLLKSHPELKEPAVALARALLAQGRTNDALRLCREMTTRFPKDPEVWTMTGTLLRQNGALADARDTFEQGLKVSPLFTPAIEQLVELDLLANNSVAAQARATQLIAAVTNSAAGYLLSAKVHVAAKDLKTAESDLLKGLQREPDSQPIHALLAAIYFDSKDYDNATKHLDAMIAGNARAFPAWMQKGTIYELKGQPDKAINAYQHAAEINATFAPALNNLALLLAENPKHLDEAFAKATRAHELAPTDPYIADTLGWICFKRRDFAAARPLLVESANKLNLAEVTYHLAMVEYATGNEEKARQQFARALQGSPGKELAEDAAAHLEVLNMNPAAATPAQITRLEAVAKRDALDYLAHFKLATAYAKTGASDKAKTEYETASRANPQSVPPLLALANLYSGTDAKRALQFAKEARKLVPVDSSVALTVGSLSVRAHEYSTALGFLQEGMRNGTTSLEILLDLAVAQFAAGKTNEAAATFGSVATQGTAATAQAAKDALVLIGSATASPSEKKSLAEAQLKADPQALLALVALAQVSEQENDFKKAAELYERVLALAPNFWPGRKQLVSIYADRLKDEKNAYTHAVKAREAAPTDPQLARTLGKIALNRGEVDNALRLFKETVQSDPTTGENYYWLGLSNLRLKRTNDCKIALNKALQMNLPSEQEVDAKKLMSQLQ